MPAQSAASVGSSSPPSPRTTPRRLPRISAGSGVRRGDAGATHLLDGVALANLGPRPFRWRPSTLARSPRRAAPGGRLGGGPQGWDTSSPSRPCVTSPPPRWWSGIRIGSDCRSRCRRSGPGGRRCRGVEPARGGPPRRLRHHGPYAAVRLGAARRPRDRGRRRFHEAEAREVDAAFCARACVIVEDRQTALRECGDVIQAIAEDAFGPDAWCRCGMSRAALGRPRKSRSSSRGRACRGRTWSSPRPCSPGSSARAAARARRRRREPHPLWRRGFGPESARLKLRRTGGPRVKIWAHSAVIR